MRYEHLVNKPFRQDGRDAVLCVSRYRRRYLLIMQITNTAKINRSTWLNYTPNNSLVSTTENSR